MANLAIRILNRAARKAGFFFQPSSSDVYLVSYPRSGNTWVRSAIALMMFGEMGEKLEDIHNYIPTDGQNIPIWRLKPADFHVVKSHAPFQYRSCTDKYRKVIYVVRDPRDVALSYYAYQTRRGAYEGEFDTFLEDWLAGRISPGSWSNHVDSWLLGRTRNDGEQLLTVSYERLSEETETVFAEISEFLGLDLSKEDIQRVIEGTSLNSMKAWEDRDPRNRKVGKNFRSIDKGRKARWKSEMDPAHAERIRAECRQAMDRLGYE